MPDVKFAQFAAHFPQFVSKEMADYATDTVFLHSRYLFVWRVGSVQMAYCTHCRKEYPHGIGQASVKHNEQTKCMNCGSEVVAKGHGMGRTRLVDEAYFVWYEKSIINPKAIVARGIYAWRDYRGDYRAVETQFMTVSMYLFEPSAAGLKANCEMYRRAYYFNGDFSRTKSVRSEMPVTMQYKDCYCSYSSVAEAVKGTPFEYSMWRQYTRYSKDLVKFFELAAKYPCVEYLTKLGLQAFVDAKLNGNQTYGAINWRGKSIEKVLRITKAEVKQLRAARYPIEPLSVHSYHYYKRRGMNFTFDQAHQLRDLIEGYYATQMKDLMPYASTPLILKYVLKQMNRKETHYSRAGDVIIAWRDYTMDCIKLGMHLEEEHVLFPNDLHKAHQKTIEKVRIKADMALNLMIAQRVPELEKYRFENDGLMIRPATSSMELFKEGKALNHCVGRYSQAYAEAKTNLFLLRRLDALEVPFYTVEVIGNKIVQARGRDNCNPTHEVDAFLKQFAAARLRRRPSNKRSAEKNQIGVAV